MTTKDTTRFLHQPRKHYAAAYLQQGRSLLDSDFNEGARLRADDRRQAFNHLTGVLGSPDNGFQIMVAGDLSLPELQSIPLRAGDSVAQDTVTLNAASQDIFPVVIQPGTVYLGGMRFVLEHPEYFPHQRDFLQAQREDVVLDQELASGNFFAVYYLHAWEQCVTAAEDPELLEQALGGPDTTVRVRRMRRVEVTQLVGTAFPPVNCDEAFFGLVGQLQNGDYDFDSGELRSQGRLQLVFNAGNDDDPCTPDPPTQYLGTENQALRIMLTQPDRFVWGLDNGAPLYRVKITSLGNDPEQVEVTMLNPPRDREHQPRGGQVVEFLPFAALLDPDEPHTPSNDDYHFNKMAAEIGVFTRVRGGFDANSNTFKIETDLITPSGDTAAGQLENLVYFWEDHPADKFLRRNGTVRYFFMRLWHDAPTGSAELPTNQDPDNASAALGNTGIIPVFHRSGRRGDFWTATLRVDARNRIVPFDLLTSPEGVAPHGPRHFYMPLSLITFENEVVNRIMRVRDVRYCRPRIRPLRDTGCETRTVGDGLKSIGDYKLIQEAIDSLPLEGGRVVVRPGIYREELELRSGVTLEGCGDDTILETPPMGQATGLITMPTNVSDVKIRSFRIHAIEQPAIRALESLRLELSSLNIIAYIQVSGGTAPGSGDSDEALISLDGANEVVLRAIRLEPADRPGLRMGPTAQARIEGLSASNSRQGTEPPAFALVRFNGVEDLVVRGMSLECFGQVALSLENGVRTRISQLEVLVGAHDDGTATRSAIDIIDEETLELSDSRVVQEATKTEHAAIVLLGNDVVIRDTLIEAIPHCLDASPPVPPNPCNEPLAVAWGGIQVRGGSQRIQLLRNHIRGGLGHGITLGSVIWALPSEAFPQREGAGKVHAKVDLGANPPFAFVDGQLGNGFLNEQFGSTFVAFDEGAVIDVLIAENRIEQMATNGISVLTVLGLTNTGLPTALFETQRLRIERNTIVNNLLQLPTTLTLRNDVTPLSTAGNPIPQDLQVLPYAGITLAALTQGAKLSGNQIVNNGSSSTVPTCGLFVFNGDGVVISKNRIVDNGAVPAPTDTLLEGLRAGIAVLLAGTNTARDTGAIDGVLAVDADPLVEARTLNQDDFAAGFALRIVDNTVRQPEGRALHAISAGMVSVDGNYFISLGYHGASTSVDQMAIGDVVFVQGLGGPWETFDSADFDGAGFNDRDFEDFLAPNRSRGWLVNSVEASPRLYVGGGGGVLFHNNQVVYDWDVKIASAIGEPLSRFPVVIIGQDHVGVIGNQLAMRFQADASELRESISGLVPEVFLAHALVGGFTTQAARNRVAEPVTAARISMITSGEAHNLTTLNIGTHAIFGYRWGSGHSFTEPEWRGNVNDIPASFLEQNNPALFLPTGVDVYDDDLKANFALYSLIRSFFELLNQRVVAP